MVLQAFVTDKANRLNKIENQWHFHGNQKCISVKYNIFSTTIRFLRYF